MEEKQEIQFVETKKEVSLRTQEGFVEVAKTFLHNNGDIVVPPNYDVNDAVKSLYLNVLEVKDKNKRPALEVCTQESIKQCVQNYVSKGLNIAKKQCYLVVYGNNLTLMESYFGKQKNAKEYANVKINTSVIYKDEEVKINVRPDGSKTIEHKPDFSKFNTDNIVGAYAVAVNISTGEVVNSDIMTINEIKKSWAKSSSGGDVHKQFPVEMCRKTVAGRLAKSFINTSDDEYKFTHIDSDIGNISIDANDMETETKKVEEDVIIVDDAVITETTSKESFEPVDPNAKTQTINYSEYKNNKEKYKLVPNSYNSTTKTVEVYC